MSLIGKTDLKKEEFDDESMRNWWYSDSKEELSKICMMVLGEDGTGKSGIVMNYPLQETEKMFIMDLDGGCKALLKYQKNQDSFIIKNPKVTNETGNNYDWEKTFENIRKGIEWVRRNHEKEKIKVFVFDGLSKFLNACEASMRIQINAKTMDGVALRYWKLRKEKFNLIIDLIKDLPIERIYIGHPKFILNADEYNSAVVAGINQAVFQRIVTIKENDATTLKFKAKITKCKTNILLENKEFTFAEVSENDYKWDASKLWDALLK